MTAFYQGNRAALTSIRFLRKKTDDEEVNIQLGFIEKEIIQLRTFINENIPGSDLPVTIPDQKRPRGK